MDTHFLPVDSPQSDTEFWCSICCWQKQAVGQIVALSVIWDTLTPMLRHWYVMVTILSRQRISFNIVSTLSATGRINQGRIDRHLASKGHSVTRGDSFSCQMLMSLAKQNEIYPDSKVHGANIGPIWGRQDPGGPHVGPVNFAIWESLWKVKCEIKYEW